jgi:ketosteroid isomerase-like protein
MYKRLLVLPAVFLFSACSNTSVDVEAERQALIETDQAWASAQAAGDMERVFSYWADDAVIIPAGMEAVRGQEAIREFVTTNQAQRGFSLRWEPQDATVSRAGDIGYTVGNYEISMGGPGGTPLVSQGRYLTIWRKDATGAWKCALEIHSPLSRTSNPELRMGQPGN